MNYKPYSTEWTRKRILKEALQQYFDEDINVDVILSDITSILEDNIEYHSNRATKFQEVLDSLK